MDPDALRAALARHWGQDKALVDLVVYKGREMDQLYPDLKGNEQVAILYESWMPPIKEHERQLKTLRKGLGKHVLIKLVLLGIPGQGVESVCLKPEKQYLETWKAFLRRMGDPYLMLEEPRR